MRVKVASRLIDPAAGGLAYATLVFGAGFVLGAIRVIAVAPRAGATTAVLLETPLILGVSWWLAPLCATRFRVSRVLAARLAMGLVAFAILMTAELTLARVLFGRTVPEYLSSLATVPGAIGLAAQVLFASFPLATVLRRGRTSAATPTHPRIPASTSDAVP